MKYCKYCGRELKKENSDNVKGEVCFKHREQLRLYGFTLDNIRRNKYDPNEIILHKDYAEIKLYDKFQEEEDESLIVDLDDINKLKDIRWDKVRNNIIADIHGDKVLLPNYILDTDEKIEIINGNILDCRKENLRVLEIKKKKKSIYNVSKKNKNKVIVEILGKNNTQVTGSSTLVSIPIGDNEYMKVLIELGGNQTNKDLYTEYLLNKEIIDNVPCSEIDYVFVLHTHQDHILNLPSLIPNGFRGKVISNEINKELMLPMLVDGSYIHNKNVRAINNSKKHNIPLMFTEEDVYLLLNRTETYEMNEIHELNDVLSFKFINAGHILGSCQLILYCKTPTGQVKKLHFTSDLGSDYNRFSLVPSKDKVKSSNFTLTEATYNSLDRGFKSKKECDKERSEFKEFILRELKQNRKILISVFAQSRQQNIMSFLYDNFKDDENFKWDIYIDGVLGNKINQVYWNVLKGDQKEYWKNVLNWEKFHCVKSYDNSLQIASNKEPKIVISSSGMFENGRIVNHLKAMIEKKNCTIVLCGYQGEGTTGHQLQEESVKEIKIEGMTYDKRCKIYQMNTWSSHIQAEENIKYMSQINTPLIVINHSDEGKFEFRDIMEDELRKRNNSAKIVCSDEDNYIFYI